jgi:hypothetical protein
MGVTVLKKTRVQKLPSSVGTYMKDKSIEIPKFCPSCGVSNNPQFFIEGYRNFTDGPVSYISCMCLACEHWSFIIVEALSKNDENTKPWKLLAQYPSNSIRVFDSLLQKCSPRFIEIYNSAFDAEQNGHIDLAGMGYRASLEVLIKDWALEYSGEDKSKIARYSLNDAIAHFLSDDNEAFASSDVVRAVGNDFTHWSRPDDFNPEDHLNIVKTYLEIFINSVLVKLQISNPPAGRAYHSDSNSN